ncbi:T9SS type A sorting domain-containing protein [Adhaeribacter terreus]|uniref:T9SS type A sorting domain-containing protein n=1 Tax=Adhaeribacter terreus TaxID=529703 RepID=A0ABW0EG23_9BACT
MKRKSTQFSGSIYFTLCLLLLNISFAKAQVILTNLNPYTQNFNSLPASGSSTWNDNATLPGWYVDNGPATNLVSSNGSDTNAGLKNYGITNASDRALGCVTSNASGNFYYGIRLRNNTGATIRDFEISYRLEQWRTLNNRSTTVKFSYKKGTTVTALSGSGWTDHSDLNIKTDKGIVSGSVNGNSSGNYYNSGSILLSEIELANGEEIMLRWNDPDNNSIYLGLDDITITPSNTQRIFYNETSGTLSSLSNWTANVNGSNGDNPTSFTASYQTFVIKNSTNPTISSNWTVNGEGSKVVVGNGSANVNFTIPANKVFSGVIDVTDYATLTINNTTCPSLGILGDLSTVTINNASTQTLTQNAFGNLTLLSGTTQLSANTRIKNSLSLSGGKLELGNFDLTLDAGSFLSNANANSYIITNGTGSLKRQVQKNNTDVEFPVGTSTAYLPVKIRLANTANTVTDIFSVKAIDFVYDNYTSNVPTGTKFSNKAVNNTWIIDEAVAGNSDVTLTFQWNAASALSDFDLNQTRISHFHNGSWDDDTPVTATLINGLYTVSRSNITSFSPFGVFSGTPNPLPVELLKFEASRSKNGIVCSWETASEKNNHYFTIERSHNGKEFQESGRVAGAGTTSQHNRYSFADSTAPASLTYYRLRQTDFDGTTTYSKIVAVAAKNEAITYTLFPNPAQGIRYLKTTGNTTMPVHITVTNLQGKTILQTTAEPQNLRAGFPIDLTKQAAGLYFIQINSGNNFTTIRTIKP